MNIYTQAVSKQKNAANSGGDGAFSGEDAEASEKNGSEVQRVYRSRKQLQVTEIVELEVGDLNQRPFGLRALRTPEHLLSPHDLVPLHSPFPQKRPKCTEFWSLSGGTAKDLRQRRRSKLTSTGIWLHHPSLVRRVVGA